MVFMEKKISLFKVPDEYYFAHCISSDYELGAGIAVEFQRRFHLKGTLKALGSGQFPKTIRIGHVFNLVTKAKYWNKPTYQSLQSALEQMRDLCVKDGIKYLAMPKIGSGLISCSGQKFETLFRTYSKTPILIF